MGDSEAAMRWPVGLAFDTARRTITDTDIVSFAGWSGDCNPLHVDELYAAGTSPYGARIAHGQLIAAIVSGLSSPLDDWPVLSYVNTSRLFRAPVLAGDTIHGRYRISAARPSRTRCGASLVSLALDVVNQSAVSVMTGEDVMLVADQPALQQPEPWTEGIFLEDIEVGRRFSTSRRTVTDADIVWFSGISGDHSPLHTDERFIREHTAFRGRIAQGWLLVGIQSGLRSELLHWRILAYLQADRRFRAPTYPGDTIEARYAVVSVQRSRSSPDRGVVRLECQMVNQNGDVVLEGTESFMIAARTVPCPA